MSARNHSSHRSGHAMTVLVKKPIARFAPGLMILWSKYQAHAWQQTWLSPPFRAFAWSLNVERTTSFASRLIASSESTSGHDAPHSQHMQSPVGTGSP